jgi:hypothetical protein
VAFCDGHVESPTLQFLFADTSDAALSRWNRDHQPHRERLVRDIGFRLICGAFCASFCCE